MAGESTDEFPEEIDDDDLEIDEDDLDEEVDDEFEADVDVIELVKDADPADAKADEESEEEAEEEEEHDEALEELEAAELEIEDDPETLLVDEAAEIREMRREELGISANTREQSSDEFVCTECFLVKNVGQLANKSRRVCRDCI